jgi:hypothetical protein
LDGGEGGADQQMQAMREQMEQMRAQLEQRALQQSPPAADPGAPPAAQQPLSGYRRPEPPPTQAPAASAAPTASPAPTGLPGGARPSIEGSPYDAVLPDGQPSPLGSESSPFARLEAEQTAAEVEAEAAAPPAASDGGTFRPEPQRLVSSNDAPASTAEEEDPGEVDRVLLAKEFSGLLQVDEDGDEN